MCEIQLIKRFGGKNLTTIDKQNFIYMMERGARSNNHAYGVFGDDYLYKQGISYSKKAKLPLSKMGINKVDTTFLVGHNRFTTSGAQSDNRNNHPFENDDWIVVHNGVLCCDEHIKAQKKFEYDEEVDSIIILKLLEYYKGIGKTTIECLKETAEELNGSYSVVVYNKNDKNLYYFKNGNTDFEWALIIGHDNEKRLVGSTKKDNLLYSYRVRDMGFEYPDYKMKVLMEAKPEVIYCIDDLTMAEVASFEADETWGYDYGYTGSTVSKYRGSSATFTGNYENYKLKYPGISTILMNLEEDIELALGGMPDIDYNYAKGYVMIICRDKTTRNLLAAEFPLGRKVKKGLKFKLTELYEEHKAELDSEDIYNDNSDFWENDGNGEIADPYEQGDNNLEDFDDKRYIEELERLEEFDYQSKDTDNQVENEEDHVIYIDDDEIVEEEFVNDEDENFIQNEKEVAKLFSSCKKTKK